MSETAPITAREALSREDAQVNTDDADPVTVLRAVAGCALHWEGDARLVGNVRAKDIVRAITASLSAAPVQVETDEYAAGVRAAAKFVAKRRDDYHNEKGYYDPSTGVWEYPDDGDEYIGELEEIEEGIRALIPPAPSTRECRA